MVRVSSRAARHSSGASDRSRKFWKLRSCHFEAVMAEFDSCVALRSTSTVGSVCFRWLHDRLHSLFQDAIRLHERLPRRLVGFVLDDGGRLCTNRRMRLRTQLHLRHVPRQTLCVSRTNTDVSKHKVNWPKGETPLQPRWQLHRRSPRPRSSTKPDRVECALPEKPDSFSESGFAPSRQPSSPEGPQPPMDSPCGPLRAPSRVPLWIPLRVLLTAPFRGEDPVSVSTPPPDLRGLDSERTARTTKRR